jgi:hypothetical protein
MPIEFSDLFSQIYNDEADKLLYEQVAQDQLDPKRRSLRPTVVLCLGGTGMEIGARLRNKLRKYYSAVNAGTNGKDDLRQMVQFVALDTRRMDRQPKLLQNTFSESEFKHIGGFIPALYLENCNETEFPAWWDKRWEAGAASIDEGADRIRQLGRLCLYYYRHEVTEIISRAIRDATALDKAGVRNGRVANLGGSGSNTPSCVFYILSGSCGGTGSGTFIDATYLALKAATDHNMLAPVVRAMVMLPTLHIEANKTMQLDMGPISSSNAYAFMKEAQHFQFPDGRKRLYTLNFEAHTMPDSASTMKIANTRAWDRFYLLDCALADRNLTDIPDVFELGAESLFHLMAQPTGMAEEGAMTNAGASFAMPREGRPVAFGTMGISHIVYPAKTLARRALCDYLDTLHTRMLGTLAPAAAPDAKSAEELAAELVGNTLALRIDDLTTALRNEGNAFLLQLQTEATLTQQFETNGDGKFLVTAVPQQRELVKTLATQAKARMQSAYEDQVAAHLQSARDTLESYVNGLAGTRSLTAATDTLDALRVMLDGMLPAYTADGSADGATDDDFTNCFNDAQTELNRMIGDIVPDNWWLQKPAFLRIFGAMQGQARDLITKAVSAESISLARQYRQKVLDCIADIRTRADRVHTILVELASNCALRADDTNTEEDEGTLPVTTQHLPPDCLQANSRAHQELLAAMTANLDADISTFLTALTDANSALLNLGASDEHQRRTAFTTYIHAIVGAALAKEADLRACLCMNLRQVAGKYWGEDQLAGGPFVTDYQDAALRLASWPVSLNLELAQLRLVNLPSYLSVGLPGVYLQSGALIEPLEFHPDLRHTGAHSPMDNRRLSILRTLYGFPLYALTSMANYKTHYEAMVKQLDSGNSAHVPHSGVDFGSLRIEDLFRTPKGVNHMRSFVMATFTDWLLQGPEGESELKDAARRSLTGMISDHTRGLVYVNGSVFYFVELKKNPGTRKKGSALFSIKQRHNLNPGGAGSRQKAYETFTALPYQETLKLYLAHYETANAKDARAQLLQEYHDYLTSRRTELTEKKEQDATVALMDMELNALEAFITELESLG